MTRLRRFSESLPMLLLRARETAMARFRPILHAHGLTEQQWRALRALHDLGELTAAGLARECAILAPSMTRILRKLGELGYVTTVRSSADHRELKVRITSEGQRIVDEVGPKVEQEYARLCGQFSADRIDSLYRDLKDLIELGQPSSEPDGSSRE